MLDATLQNDLQNCYHMGNCMFTQSCGNDHVASHDRMMLVFLGKS